MRDIKLSNNLINNGLLIMKNTHLSMIGGTKITNYSAFRIMNNPNKSNRIILFRKVNSIRNNSINNGILIEYKINYLKKEFRKRNKIKYNKIEMKTARMMKLINNWQ